MRMLSTNRAAWTRGLRVGDGFDGSTERPGWERTRSPGTERVSFDRNRRLGEFLERLAIEFSDRGSDGVSHTGCPASVARKALQGEVDKREGMRGMKSP